MNWNKWIRLTHRWASVAFTLAVLINGIAVLQGKYTAKLGPSAVAVLAVQFVTGLYLFLLPYTAKLRSPRRTG
jgi:hypothetical protein